MRTLMDIYLYNSKMGERLNYKYIEEQNSLLGTNEYEKASRRIADAIFSPGAEDIYSADLLDEGDREILLYYISSGTFGTREILIDNELKNISEGGEITGTTKLKYYLRRLFPDFDYYKTTYPRASKFILTIPFLWLIRVFRGITKHERLAGEVRRVKNK